MVEDTESPRMYHVWGALLAIGACLGRRVYLPFGYGRIYANQYVWFVGNPGTRKTTAMRIPHKLLKECTGIRFSPDDTGGQRQGLIAAMQHEPDKEESAIAEIEKSSLMGHALSLEAIGSSESIQTVNSADVHTMTIMAAEVSRFLGQNNFSMLDFLIPMWDGDDFKYQLKASEVTLENPLLNFLGCTTPTSIAQALPAAAQGQGFLSRVILVYGQNKYKQVPRPGIPPESLVSEIKKYFSNAYYNLHGPVQETPEALAYSEELYKYVLDIVDSRFSYYAERRYHHMLKLGIILAASRGSTEIIYEDYEQAHQLLRATEKGMPEALGQFGMSPLAQLKQNILEYCRQETIPITVEMLRAVFHRDGKPEDIQDIIRDLVASSQLIQQRGEDNIPIYIAKRSANDIESDIMNLLTET